MVRSELSTSTLLRWITPATSNTIILPGLLTASRSEPSPLSSSVVTRYTSPPRPPVAKRPKPSAPETRRLHHSRGMVPDRVSYKCVFRRDPLCYSQRFLFPQKAGGQAFFYKKGYSSFRISVYK